MSFKTRTIVSAASVERSVILVCDVCEKSVEVESNLRASRWPEGWLNLSCEQATGGYHDLCSFECVRALMKQKNGYVTSMHWRMR